MLEGVSWHLFGSRL